jgi:DNA-binding IscR family transcriptional regulator
LQTVWIALRSGIRGVLEHVTLADVVGGSIPKHVLELAEEPDAWTRR